MQHMAHSTADDGQRAHLEGTEASELGPPAGKPHGQSGATARDRVSA